MSIDCTMLVLSCDANLDVLKIFLDQFESNKNDFDFPTFVCLEKESIEYDGFEVLLSSEKSWSKRIQQYIKQVDTKYIMIILDDFIVEKKIQVEDIHMYLNMMKENKNIARITLSDLKDNNAIQSSFVNLKKQNSKANYLLNLQVSIWDKDIFNSLLNDKETPWQVELYGSIRARKYAHLDFLYIYDNHIMPIVYNKGWLVVRGRWNQCEIDRLKLYDTYSQSYFAKREIKEIHYLIEESSFWFRIKRRIAITMRQILSYFKIYY